MRKVYILLFITLLPAEQALAQQKTEQGGNSPQEQAIVANPQPDNWSKEEPFYQTLPVDDEWWRNFNDPVLDSLITVASCNNYSVLAAMENIKKARAAWRSAQGNLMPSFDLGLEVAYAAF